MCTFVLDRTKDSASFSYYELISSDDNTVNILNGYPHCCLVLRESGEAVYCNKNFTSFFGIKVSDIVGKHFGEIAGCPSFNFKHKENCESCCKECAYYAFSHNVDSQPIEVALKKKIKFGEKYSDVKITVINLKLCKNDFKMLIMEDISRARLEDELNMTFLHDILNTVSGLNLMAEFAALESRRSVQSELFDTLSRHSIYLIEEIKSHKALLKIKGREDDRILLSAETILRTSAEIVWHLAKSTGVSLKKMNESCDCIVQTNPVLLRRVIVNLLKNAVEASASGQSVTYGCMSGEDDYAYFYVQNESVMAEKAQKNLFNMKFSSKGKERGTGSVSAKILSELYLGGEISFVSNDNHGTVFMLRLPVICGEAESEPKRDVSGLHLWGVEIASLRKLFD